ncbi:HDOD domain-containing protein [Permianibacter aggregans]|uniref:HD-like signal output (HDOD) protein n=1 Tax=Permianibacter aggregans TaxID=1510150 RepID=A0A4R6UMF7_9GAMM|nr:HDOD domain-containing protein [Permianibacter aggregans]QGX41037.1 HDOD domain-containing protein [Permianibacter aggregans]TDQ48101.1 HD-like signal output (HDOD) protein [Permianibacter aggregans]
MSITALFARLHDDINFDRLKMPALPDVALRVQQVMQSPDCDLASLARLIQLDPGLSAYLLQIVNSPLYRGARKVDQLATALARMGLSATRNYVYSYAMMALYEPQSPVLKPLLKKQWQFSTRLAALSSVLAPHFPPLNTDQATLAGLMQDIGMLPLLAKIVEYPQLLTQKDLLLETLERFAGQVGASLLERWNFDESLVETARARGDWQRDHHGPADYADIVTIARFHALLGTPQAQRLPGLAQIPAFKKLPASLKSPSFSMELLTEAKAQVQEIQRGLAGSS